VNYELGFYIPEDAILHSDRRETSNLTCLRNITAGRGMPADANVHIRFCENP
jgi:hypothetical protein